MAQASIVPAFRGALDLDHNKDYYYHPDRNLLIELTEEVVAKLVAVEPNCVHRLRTDDHRHQRRQLHWRLGDHGPWPYELPTGFTRPISVSIQSYANGVERFTHGMLHHFGLVGPLRARGRHIPAALCRRVGQHGGTLQQRAPAGLVEGARRLADRPRRHDHLHCAARVRRELCGASIRFPCSATPRPAANRKAIAIGLSQGRSDPGGGERLLLRGGAQQCGRDLRQRAARLRRAHLLRQRARASGRGAGDPARQEPSHRWASAMRSSQSAT